MIWPCDAASFTVTDDAGAARQPFDTWAGRSPVRKPPVDVKFTYDSKPCDLDRLQASGCTDGSRMWVRPEECQSFNRYGRCAFVFWHELGHIVDHWMLTDADRDRFAAAIGMAGRPWYTSVTPGPKVEGTPAEQWASAYALVAMYGNFRRAARVDIVRSWRGLDCTSWYCLRRPAWNVAWEIARR